jgi:RES domain-containing protein
VVSQTLVEAIDRLPPTPYRGTAFRHQPPKYAPLSGRGARIVGGRWNPPDSFSVLYLGLSREIVRAEFRRHARRQGLALDAFLPRSFYRYELSVENLLDLRDEAACAALGLHGAELTGDSVRRCQAVGEAAHFIGREGIVAPSAAGAGTVVALFPDALMPNSEIQPTKREQWDLPADAD